jgi:hypothetical protein
LQIQDADDLVLAAKRCHKVLSDESISACNQDAATAGRRRFYARLQGYGFHVRSSKRVDPMKKKTTLASRSNLQ